MKHPILVLILAAFAILASQARAGISADSIESVAESPSYQDRLILASESQQNQQQGDTTEEYTEEEPDCE